MKNLYHIVRHLPAYLWTWTVRKGVLALIIVFGLLTLINAQSSGSRGGLSHQQYHPSPSHDLATISQSESTEIVSVEAKVELRVAPDQIRIVLAVTGDGKTSTECQAKVSEKIQQLRKSLGAMEIPDENIVEDFIAILPEYKFEIETREGEQFAVERMHKFNMQSNLHIKVENDAQALKAIYVAFEASVTDIIAFDYWSTKLDDKKSEALKLAIEKAKAKSEMLLGATFDNPLKPINITSGTLVVMPDKLYESFGQSYSQSVTQERYGKARNLPVIHAVRPKNTYYRGHFDEFGDQHSGDVPMRPEITVVAEVEMHYASPVAIEYRRLMASAKE